MVTVSMLMAVLMSIVSRMTLLTVPCLFVVVVRMMVLAVRVLAVLMFVCHHH